MKFARDFREAARNALRGHWGLAVGAGIVASILGAGNGSLPDVGVNINAENNVISASVEFGMFTLDISENVRVWMSQMVQALPIILVSTVIMSVALFIVSSVVDVGYAKFNLKLIDRSNPEYSNLFEYFKHWKSAVLMNLLRMAYIFLWMLLFIIPGFIAAFRYSMASFILAENPELSANEAISRSKEMMRGNKRRLFCLIFSFIGWDLLSALTGGIGNLWLAPYKKAAMADFYREVSYTRFGTAHNENVTPTLNGESVDTKNE